MAKLFLILLNFCFCHDCSTLKDIKSCSVAINGGRDKNGCLWIPFDNKTAGVCITRSAIKTCSDFSTKLGSRSNGRFSCENGYGRGIPPVTEILEKTSVSWNGKPYRSYTNGMNYSESQVQITARQLIFLPHTKSAVHTHSAPSLLYVKFGEVTVTEVSPDGAVVNETHIKAGQVLPELVDTPHYMFTQESTVVLISFHFSVVGLNTTQPEESAGLKNGDIVIYKILGTKNTTRSWDGTKIGKYPVGVPELSLVKITIKPDTLLGAHIHPMPTIEYMLHGKLAVVKSKTGQKKTVLTTDVWSEVVFTPHYSRNIGSNDVVLLAVYAGVQGLPYSLPYGGPAAVAVVGAGAEAALSPPPPPPGESSSRGEPAAEGAEAGSSSPPPPPSSPPPPPPPGECMWVAETKECKVKPGVEQSSNKGEGL